MSAKPSATRTSSLGTTERLRLYWDSLSQRPSTCGPWDVSLLNSFWVGLSILGLLSMIRFVDEPLYSKIMPTAYMVRYYYFYIVRLGYSYSHPGLVSWSQPTNLFYAFQIRYISQTQGIPAENMLNSATKTAKFFYRDNESPHPFWRLKVLQCSFSLFPISLFLLNYFEVMVGKGSVDNHLTN